MSCALTQRRYIAPLPALACRGTERRKAPLADRGAHAGHQFLIVGEIDLRQQHGAEHLVGADEMMQIGARIIARRRARALLVERARVLGMARIAQIDFSPWRVKA